MVRKQRDSLSMFSKRRQRHTLQEIKSFVCGMVAFGGQDMFAKYMEESTLLHFGMKTKQKIKRMKRFDLEEKYLMDLDQVPPHSPETFQSTPTIIDNEQSQTKLALPVEKHEVPNISTATTTLDILLVEKPAAEETTEALQSAPVSAPSNSHLSEQYCVASTSSTDTSGTSQAATTTLDVLLVEKPAAEETTEALQSAPVSAPSNSHLSEQYCVASTSSTDTSGTSQAATTTLDVLLVEKPAAEETTEALQSAPVSAPSNSHLSEQYCVASTASTDTSGTSQAATTTLDVLLVEKPAAEETTETLQSAPVSVPSNSHLSEQYSVASTSSTDTSGTSQAATTTLDILLVEKPAAEETTETLQSAPVSAPSNSHLSEQYCVASTSSTDTSTASNVILVKKPALQETLPFAPTATSSTSYVTELSDTEISDQEAVSSFDEDLSDDLEYRPTKSDLSYESDSEEDEGIIEEANSQKKKIRKKSNYKNKTSKMPEEGTEDNVSEGDTNIEHDMPPERTENTCCYVSDSDSSQSEIIPQYVPNCGPLSLKTSQCEDSEDEMNSDIEEDEIMRDVENKSIYIRRILRSSTSKKGKMKKGERVYNTKHCCPYCKKLVASFAQHIFSKQHENETDVKKITAAKGNERKRLILKLRNRGDNTHNESVLKSSKGEIILTRRCEEKEFYVSKYGPCPRCFGWFRLTVLDRHKCCIASESTIHISKGTLMMQSAVLCGRVTEEAGKSLLQEVFPIMTDDRVGQMAKKDRLIVALGNHWMRRNIGNKLMRKYYVSGVMRLASRLLIQLQGMTNSNLSMEDFIHPQYFTHIAKAALRVARQDDDDEENLKAPSNAIKLSYDLKRLGNMKYVRAIMNSDAVQKVEAKEFLKLMELEWSTKLSRVILQERKLNKKFPLPLPEDVQKLSCFLRKEMEDFKLDDMTYENFRNGVIFAEACLISYNRRRPGEIQALRLSVYENRKRGLDQVAEEVTRDLSVFERKLVEEQDVIEIRGKCGKVVPVLVPLHAQRVLRFLTDKTIRSAAGISSPYVFASKRGGVVRGYDALKKATEIADLQHPELIRGTNMRRLMATLSQERRELNAMLWLGKITYSMNHQRLEDIQIDELVDSPEPIEENDMEKEVEVDSQMESLIPDFHEEESLSFEEHFPDLPEEDTEQEAIPFEPRKKKKQKAAATNRHKWSRDEIQEIESLFKKWFEEDVTPGQQAIIKAKQLSKDKKGAIWKLETDKIKKKISWMRLHSKN